MVPLPTKIHPGIQKKKEDKDIRQLLTMLAIITEPNNIDVNFDPNNGGFTRKYSKYLEELQKLKPVSQGIIVTRKIEENQATSRTNQPWFR